MRFWGYKIPDADFMESRYTKSSNKYKNGNVKTEPQNRAPGHMK